MMGSVVVRQRSSDRFERSRGAAFHRAIGPSGLDVERTRVLPTVLTQSGVNILLNVASAASPGDAHRFTACVDIGMSPWPVPKLISLPQRARPGKRGNPLNVFFYDVLFARPELGFRLNFDLVDPTAAREAAHQLMYATRIQRSADRASALTASSSEAFSARRW